MNILVIGTWNPDKAAVYKEQADELGALLAEHGHTLTAAPSSGMQGLVAQSYKSHGGATFIGFYPKLSLMQEVGEVALVEPDNKVMTEEDYPVRNLLQVRSADAIIAITGGIGTTAEYIAGVDYKIPVAYLKGSSNNLDRLQEFDGVKGAANYFIGESVQSLLDFVEQYSK